LVSLPVAALPCGTPFQINARIGPLKQTLSRFAGNWTNQQVEVVRRARGAAGV